jgi:cytochrome c oxidase assembly factor CtaG
VRAPQLLSLPFSHWSLSATVTVATVLVGAVSLWSARRAARWPPRRTAALIAGLAAIAVALQSGIDGYDDRLLSAHMIQHLLLIEVAPAALLCARPVTLALRTLPRRQRRVLGRALVRTRAHASPVLCLGGYTLIVLGTHVPALFDAALADQALHDGEHLLYLLAGLLLWWPLLGEVAPSRRLGPIAQLGYITAAMLPMTLIGAFLNRDPSLFYDAYALPTRALGVSPILDQQQGGAIMWIGGTTVMAWVVLATAVRTMLESERRQRARELHELVR